MLLRRAQKLSQRIVGIAHPCRALAALFRYAECLESRAEGERLVVRRGHDDGKEWLARRVQFVEIRE